MKGALGSLRSEHKTILAVVDRLEAAARSATDGYVSRPLVRAALDFIHTYVDRNHHGKEEDALFVAMRNDPSLAGLADALVDDHGEGRSLVAAMEFALFEERPTAALILAFGAFIRGHIRREDEMIFEAVENALDQQTLASLNAKFGEIEEETLGEAGVQRLLDRLDAAQDVIAR
jgi:hemerythrin-like domain-containing protein